MSCGPRPAPDSSSAASQGLGNQDHCRGTNLPAHGPDALEPESSLPARAHVHPCMYTHIRAHKAHHHQHSPHVASSYHRSRFLSCLWHQCPGAAITKYHEPVTSNNGNIFSHPAGSRKSATKGSQDCTPHRGLRRGSFLVTPSSWQWLAFLGHGSKPPVSGTVSRPASPLRVWVSPPPALIWTFITDFRATHMIPDGIQDDPIRRSLT